MTETKIDYSSEFKLFEKMHGKFLNSVKGNIYHYCSLDTLWKILDGNSFLATHVEFSNDTEEYHIGKKFIGEILRKVAAEEKAANKSAGGAEEYTISDVDIDEWEKNRSTGCFMVCFCEDNDILSQWREYARDGVSIELDFNCLSLYQLEKLNEKTDNCFIIPNTPKKVFYINDKELSKSVEQYHKDFCSIDNRMESALFFVPYIKHIGFKEEKEVRFVFNNINGNFQDKIDYLYRKGMKVPVVKVIPFQGEEDEVLLYTNFDLESAIAKKGGVSEKLIKRIRKLESNDKCDKVWISHYFKNKLKNNKNVHTPDNKNLIKDTIYITNNPNNNKEQELVYTELCRVLKASDLKDVEIHCEGCLPIKSITIGPSKQQKEIKRGVEEFLKQFYYWSHVKVLTSDIPYRSQKSDLSN